MRAVTSGLGSEAVCSTWPLDRSRYFLMEITEDLSPETTEEKDRQNETQTLTVGGARITVVFSTRHEYQASANLQLGRSKKIRIRISNQMKRAAVSPPPSQQPCVSKIAC